MRGVPYNSIVTLIDCSFVNNSAYSGSAVHVNSSNLFVHGLETSIVNNTGTAPPFEVISGRMDISHASFAGNMASKYQAAILLLDSNISYYDVHVLKTTTLPPRSRSLNKDDCDVYVAVDPKNFANKSSCLKFDESNKTFPMIDLSDSCPTLSPTDSPTHSPTHAPIFPPHSLPTARPPPSSCFSAYNMVEIKDGAPIPMNLVRIGHLVKSSLDGTYTQVYGFVIPIWKVHFFILLS
jgi:hypothetical protein